MASSFLCRKKLSLNASSIQYIPIFVPSDILIAKSWILHSSNHSCLLPTSVPVPLFHCYNLLFMLHQNALSKLSIQIISSMRERTLTVMNSLRAIASHTHASIWHREPKASLEYCWRTMWTILESQLLCYFQWHSINFNVLM